MDPGGAWTIGEHLQQGYTITAYCNNLRCAGRAGRSTWRRLRPTSRWKISGRASNASTAGIARRS